MSNKLSDEKIDEIVSKCNTLLVNYAPKVNDRDLILVHQNIDFVFKQHNKEFIPLHLIPKAGIYSKFCEVTNKLIECAKNDFQVNHHGDIGKVVRILTKLAIKTVENDDLPVSPKLVINYLNKLDWLIDRNFPDYRRFGWLKLLINKNGTETTK
jgi:hypothetical protein